MRKINHHSKKAPPLVSISSHLQQSSKSWRLQDLIFLAPLVTISSQKRRLGPSPGKTPWISNKCATPLVNCIHNSGSEKHRNMDDDAGKSNLCILSLTNEFYSFLIMFLKLNSPPNKEDNSWEIIFLTKCGNFRQKKVSPLSSDPPHFILVIYGFVFLFLTKLPLPCPAFWVKGVTNRSNSEKTKDKMSIFIVN